VRDHDGGQGVLLGTRGEGQLGQGTTDGSTKPVAVSGGLSFQSVVAGGDHTCGVTTTQQGYCWGSWKTDFNQGPIQALMPS
jgi:hypothetical protein